MGGSPAPSGGPTQTTVQNTNIPDYAQPYVSNMLNAAQAQIFTPDMTGFQPYVPYSADPTKYIAGFSPLQQQAQSSAANLQMPGQYGAATGAAAMGTMGALGAGQQYNRMATSPYATQQFMNPYLNAALQPQLQEIGRQYDITGQQEQGQATQAGAFGGSREALMAAENQRNKNIAMNQAIGTGYNNAFQAAQQAQQFGANLGLQGAQAGIQGAGQLAGIGGQQLAAQQGIIGTQAQQGALEQQQQQNVINQAVQNYATAQQYPFLQLGLMNSMLRGLPMQQATTQMYQAPPSAVSQIAGLGTAGLGAAALYNQASRSKKGGMIKMAPGGVVPMNMYTDQQLQQVPQSPASTPMANMYAQGLMQSRAYDRGNPQAANAITQAFGDRQTPMQQGTPMNQPTPMTTGLPAPYGRPAPMGLAGAPTGQMTQMAHGGIASFADEGEVPKADDATKKALDALSESGPYGKAAAALYMQNKPEAAALAKEKAELSESVKQQQGLSGPMFATRLGLGLMAGQSQYPLVNLGTAGLGALTPYERDVQNITNLKRQLAQMDAQGVSAENKNRQALAGELFKLQATVDMKDAQLAAAGATRGQTELTRTRLEREDAQTAYNQLLTKAMSDLQASAKIGGPNYKRYKENPDMIKADAEAYALKNLNPTYRDILKLNPNLPPVVTPPANTGNAPAAKNVIKLD